MKKRDGFLNGHLLIAMPGMGDERFNRTVIYICAHSDEGAMGLVLNQRQDMAFPDLLVQLGIINQTQAIHLPEPAKLFPVRNGGPVDRSRGFVLHSDDYACKDTIPVTDKICLTSTTDILKAISMGRGPHQAIMALGYAGWAGGQLESEVAANGWLTSPVDPDFLFTGDLDHQYEQSLKRMGIDPTFLVAQAGHA
ncbi:YqgE/AlgH family protein [Bartonella sp. LJL80]